MNRNLLDKVRCMLVSLGIPKVLGLKALMIASYIVTRTPSGALGDKTLKEQWTGDITDYSI